VFDLVVTDVIGTLQFLPYALIDGVIVIIVLQLIDNIRGNKKTSFRYKLLIFSFSIYLILVLYITILSRPPGSRDSVDLTLFGTVGNNIYANSYVVENILLFIPFGLFLPGLGRKLKLFRNCLLLGVLCSVSIESIQFLTKRGYFQLDDILMNALGTVIGYIIYKIIRYLSYMNRS
jgi:glycopeptide antibiotics resistance protein